MLAKSNRVSQTGQHVWCGLGSRLRSHHIVFLCLRRGAPVEERLSSASKDISISILFKFLMS